MKSGGTIEMYGALPSVANAPDEPLQSGSGMIGIGMCPKGFEQDATVYDLMSKWALRWVMLRCNSACCTICGGGH